MLTMLLMTWASLAQQPFTPRELVDLPDPGAATTLSLGVGFGAGHFYAAQPVRGAVFAGLELGAGAGWMAIQQLKVRDMQTPRGQRLWEEQNGAEALTAAMTTFLVIRAVDVVLAPYSTRRTARKRLEHGKH